MKGVRVSLSNPVLSDATRLRQAQADRLLKIASGIENSKTSVLLNAKF